MPKFLKIQYSVFVFAFVLAGNMSTAQEIHLSLYDARQYALEYNKNLINAGLAVDEAGLKLRETIAQGLPQVDASADYSNFFGSTATFGEFQITHSPSSNFSVSVGQLLFNGSYIVGIRTAKLFREITETSLQKSEIEIKAQVTQAYYIGLISRKSRDLIESNLENMRDVQIKTRALVNAGVAEELDYDQLHVQVNMLENALRGAERQVEMSINMLRLQIGLDSEKDLVLTDNLENIVSLTDFESNLLTDFSIEENLDFRMMQLQKNIALQQVDLQRAAYLPTVMGFYNYTEKILKPEFDFTPNHVIGLNVSIPIFSSGMRNSRVKQARINLEVTENQQELLSEQLMIREKQLRFNLNSALEQYESQRTNITVAQRVFDNIRLRHQQGLISSLDLTTANNNFLQAESSYISAMLQLLDAQVEMDVLLNNI